MKDIGLAILESTGKKPEKEEVKEGGGDAAKLIAFEEYRDSMHGSLKEGLESFEALLKLCKD